MSLAQRLDILREKLKPWDACQRCPLGALATKHVQIDCGDWEETTVFGLNRLPVLLVGEAPGEAEDVVGLPFVGKSGKLLRQAISEVLREIDCYVPWVLSNCIACRPCDGPNTKNREPSEQELSACRPRLGMVLETLAPRVVVTLGRTAERAIPDPLQFSKVALTHPAAICRRGGAGTPSYNDFVRKLQGAFEIAEKFIHETIT